MKKLIHASNLLTKLNKNDNIDFLLACADEYYIYHKNFSMQNIEKSVKYWNCYLDFVRNNNKKNKKTVFSSQSKFESTILEETLFRMFKEYESEKIRIGGIKAFSNMFFSPLDFDDFKINSNIKINTKDQDFAIYKQVQIEINDNMNPVKAFVPIIAIECKTYLDKTMLEGAMATAEKIKNGNPYCRFCIVTETCQVDLRVDIKNTKIDQIYVLRKRNKNEQINADVVNLIYEDTNKHLKNKWSDIEKNIKDKGIVFN
ncbi:MAG: Bpu10I family restriction endonuclease [Prevotellaceae bacterium]|nr:Bpu10I family restriction endonuclease [Prevotellaceae bacterium]